MLSVPRSLQEDQRKSFYILQRLQNGVQQRAQDAYLSCKQEKNEVGALDENATIADLIGNLANKVCNQGQLEYKQYSLLFHSKLCQAQSQRTIL